MQALAIDQYQVAHTLAGKMQAAEVKSTRERLGSSRARLWPVRDLLSVVFTPEFLYFVMTKYHLINIILNLTF